MGEEKKQEQSKNDNEYNSAADFFPFYGSMDRFFFLSSGSEPEKQQDKKEEKK